MQCVSVDNVYTENVFESSVCAVVFEMVLLRTGYLQYLLVSYLLISC